MTGRHRQAATRHRSTARRLVSSMPIARQLTSHRRAHTGVDAGPLGSVYVTGVLSGVAMYESNFVLPDEHRFMADVTNGQVVVQKVDGPIQFYAEGGAYSLPVVGVPYLRAGHATGPAPAVAPAIAGTRDSAARHWGASIPAVRRWFWRSRSLPAGHSHAPQCASVPLPAP